MPTQPAFVMVGVPRASHSRAIDARKLLVVAALLAGAATPSDATTITYDIAVRVGAAVATSPT